GDFSGEVEEFRDHGVSLSRSPGFSALVHPSADGGNLSPPGRKGHTSLDRPETTRYLSSSQSETYRFFYDRDVVPCAGAWSWDCCRAYSRAAWRAGRGCTPARGWTGCGRSRARPHRTWCS